MVSPTTDSRGELCCDGSSRSLCVSVYSFQFELDGCGIQSIPSDGKGIFDVGDAYAGLASGGDSVQAAVGKPVAMAYHTHREATLTTQC